MGAFRDFIPEGEDPGALGSGFKDFVPPREKNKQDDKPEEKEETPKGQPKQSPFAKK